MFSCAIGVCLAQPVNAQDDGLLGPSERSLPRMVKIMGSGGFQGLEPYQSGFLISEDGLILTSWSYVLDSGNVKATFSDGQVLDAKLIGYDPRVEIALIKVEADGLPFFNLNRHQKSQPGDRVLAFSNLYGVARGEEQVSVQHGIVSAVTKLSARRGAFESAYQGPVYLLDAVTNNPGAAGGAVTNRHGELIGVIGKELRDRQTGLWLNFAIPIGELNRSIELIRSGNSVVQSDSNSRKPSEPITLDLLGIALVPNVVDRTPPFVDRINIDSRADRAGIHPDDLIIDINGTLTPSIKHVLKRLATIDRDSQLQITLQRGAKFLTIEIGVQ